MARLAGYLTGVGSKAIDAMLRAMGSDGGLKAATGAGMFGCSDQANGWFNDDRVTVVFDGQLYNREEFRQPTGPAMGDAALIATAYWEAGFEALLQRTNGDFAIALYDHTTKEIYLARDRFGVKPLYYVDRLGLLAFASRPIGLCFLPGLDPVPRAEYVALFAAGHYRFFDNPPTRSPFAAIAQLPAASYLHHKGGTSRVQTYYRPADGDAPESEGELVEAYRNLLLDSVRRRLARAERPAFTLSGGLDSSSVACSALALTGNAPEAFSTVYGGGTYDESEEVSDIIDAGKACWHPVQVESSNFFHLVDHLTTLHDQPLSTVTWLAHYQLCERVKRLGFTTLFGGLGGDEQHAGEYDYFFYFFADLLAAGDKDRYRREVAAWQRLHDHPTWPKTPQVAEAERLALTDPHTPGRCRSDRSLLGRYAEVLQPDFLRLETVGDQLDHLYTSYLRSHGYNELYRETMPCCLRASDRNTASFGLDDAFPFFDHRLVDFMFRVPSAMKTRDGVTKQILRKAMRGVLPEATRTRSAKTGWNAPAHIWFSTDLREPLLDLVGSRRWRERGIYRPEVVEHLIREHFEIVSTGDSRENHMMFLWQLVSLESWLAWVDGLAVSAAGAAA